MPEEAKAMIRRFVEEVWNKGNLAVADEVFAVDYLDHNPAMSGQAPGLEGAKQVFTTFRAAFPDLHFTIEDIITEGDKVVWRWTSLGTHKGELMGIPATEKQVTVTGIEVYRIADGKVVERWANLDQLGMMQQLGAIPS